MIKEVFTGTLHFNVVTSDEDIKQADKIIAVTFASDDSEVSRLLTVLFGIGASDNLIEAGPFLDWQEALDKVIKRVARVVALTEKYCDPKTVKPEVAWRGPYGKVLVSLSEDGALAKTFILYDPSDLIR